MKKIILTSLLSILLRCICAQNFVCNMPQPNTSVNNGLMQVTSTSTVCNDIWNYTIYPNYNFTPVKTLRISFEVFQRNDGSGSFVGSDQQIREYFSGLIDKTNQLLSNLQAHIPTVTTNYIVDSNIRFKLNQVYIFKDDNLYNYTLKKRDRQNADSIYNNIILKRTDLTDIDKYHTLHIIMEPKGPDGSFGGQAEGIASNKWIVMRAYDYSYNSDLSKTGTYINAINNDAHHIIHEAGHAMGLYHIFDYYFDPQRDYGSPGTINTTNNFMDYGNFQDKVSLTEYQISKIHYSFMGNYGTINQDYIADYCYFNDSQSITVNSGQDIIWSNARNLIGNIIVEGKLTTKCRISIPKNGKASINNGGQIIVDQGVFDNQCDEDWGGITVKSGGLLVLNGTTISDYNITVEAGGSLIIKGSLLMSGNHAITVQGGGYLCIEIGTTVQLTDYNSVIKIGEGSFNGVNPALSISSSCISNPSAIIPTGNGAIADFNQDVYIQNLTIGASRYIGGKNIYVGNHVTTAQTVGDVKISNGASVIFDCKNITFDTGFECVSGSSYEVKNH